MMHRMSHLRASLFACAALLLTAAPALAQIPAKPGQPPQANPWFGWLMAIVCLAAACIGAFKSSKRTHQD
jgi:hypothetical protein